ncbi:MAG: MlaD family protein, partial [Thermodesulfobacteriota bacterium]
MYKKKTEFTVGIFMVLGIFCLIYLSVSLGNIDLVGSRYYSTTAIFDSITGLRAGAPVEIAGVGVGKVKGITLEDDMAMVELNILKTVPVTEDVIASIRTKGVIGEKYI